ncbi:hypothetical protein ACQY0O_005227 [Thecaphora frezii]
MSCNPTNEQDGRDDERALDPASSSAGLSAVDGDATNLYPYIIRHKIWGSNLDPPESAKNAIKPWDQRLSTADCVQSNVDDQLAITVPFTCPVRIKSILINTGTGDFAPTRCRAFVNRPDGIDFDEADAATADTHPEGQPTVRIASTLGAVGSGRAQADFALLRGEDGVVEYPVSVARFSSTNSVTLILSHSNATTLSRFFYLGFRGTALQLAKDPSERLDIAAANAADKPVDGVREKRTASHGLAGGSSGQATPRYVVSDKDAAQRIAGMTQRTGDAAPNTTPRKGRASRSSGGGDPATPSLTRTVAAGSSPSSDKANRRRSLSQPPPTETLVRHLHQQQAREQQQQRQQQQQLQASATGAAASLLRTPRGAATSKTPLRSAATPGRRALKTPHRPSEHSVGDLAQTPATEKRKRRNEALLASTQRTREKRRQSIWGLGGWGGGREESPFDLLRRLARAPGFVAPPTPQPAIADAAKTPPQGSNAGAAGHLREGPGAGGRSSTSGRRSSMLRPGESVPGDLTRDSGVGGDTMDLDDSADASADAASGQGDGSLVSEAGRARRKSPIRGGIFAALAERGRSAHGRASDAASRLSLGTLGDVSAFSAATSGLGGLREGELERSLALSLGDVDASVSASTDDATRSLDETEARAMERLDELTRRSFFSNDGGLSYGEEPVADRSEAASKSARSFMRSMSEPLLMDDGEVSGDLHASLSGVGADVEEASDLPGRDDGPSLASITVDAAERSRDTAGDGDQSHMTVEEEPDQSRLTIGSTDAGDGSSVASAIRSRAGIDDSLGPLPERSALSDSRSRSNVLLPQDESDVIGRSAPLMALSDEDEPTDTDDDDDEDNEDLGEGRRRGADVRKLDLMDPKDLNALLKRRVVRKRKARVSPYTGNAVPQLPASMIKDLFSSFLNPSAGSQTSASLLSSSSSGRRSSAKLDKATLEEVEDASHDFFALFAQLLLLQARSRTKRRANSSAGVIITEVDVLALLKHQGHVTARSDITSIAHRLLPREVLDQMNLPKLASARTEAATPSLRSLLTRKTAGDTEPATTAGGSEKKRSRREAEEEKEQETEESAEDDDDGDETSNDASQSRSAARAPKRPAQKARPMRRTSDSHLPRTPVRRAVRSAK